MMGLGATEARGTGSPLPPASATPSMFTRSEATKSLTTAKRTARSTPWRAEFHSHMARPKSRVPNMKTNSTIAIIANSTLLIPRSS